MNWGHKIGLVYLAFVIFMVTLVTLCMKQKDIDLVSEDYYTQELKYEQKLTQMRNTSGLAEEVNIYTSTNSDSLKIELTAKSAGTNCEVSMYRPSDPKLDFKKNLVADSNGEIVMLTDGVQKGLWVAKILWTSEGKTYYKEQKIQI
ncbi:FixH family protein [Lacihabitans lacunae]|jgi:hypothetical protein|uniref:FixH family protein n=1 Tax=Lacihabitans lacunae TaxID=1028214 RepID=A0ABV7YX36_9BACT